MKRILTQAALPLLLILLTGFPARAQDTGRLSEFEEYWQKTGLKTLHFSFDIIPHCYENEEAFLGCISALSAYASHLSPPATVETSLEKKDHPKDTGELILELAPGLGLYSMKSKTVRTQEELQKLSRAFIAMRSASSKMAFEQTRKSEATRIRFDQALDALDAKVGQVNAPGRNAAQVAEMYNVFYSIVFDPHTQLLPSAYFEDRVARGDTDASVFGFTLRVDRAKKTLQIRDIEPGSEAEKAGLRWNDRILEINGTEVREEAILSDPSGWMQDQREVDLRVQRAGAERIRIHLKRSLLELENVESHLVRDLGTDLGYIRIRSFMDGNLDEKTLTAIEKLEKAGARGLILDLRGNPGGLMDQAGKVASLFVGKKPITTERLLDADQHGIQNENSSQTVIGPYSAATRLPLAVLIDAGSASASEVVAGALQDHARGWIIGDRSYGKGSMQQPVPFKTRYFDFTGKINLQVTFARFYRPSGGTTQIRGVTPNFEIDPRPRAKPEEKIAFREEDSFMNPIQPEGEAWRETRLDEVRLILECRKRQDAEGLYRKIARSRPVQGPDFRLYAAEEILLCQDRPISATR